MALSPASKLLANNYPYHQAMGKALGYPQYCINSFAAGRGAFYLTEAEDSMIMMQPIRFIPCPKHTADMMAGVPLSSLLREPDRKDLGGNDIMAIKDMVLLLLGRSKNRIETHVDSE